MACLRDVEEHKTPQKPARLSERSSKIDWFLDEQLDVIEEEQGRFDRSSSKGLSQKSSSSSNFVHKDKERSDALI